MGFINQVKFSVLVNPALIGLYTKLLRYSSLIAKVLNKCYKNTAISRPKTNYEWDQIKEGFKTKAGFPNIIGAIDGTLICIKRYF